MIRIARALAVGCALLLIASACGGGEADVVLAGYERTPDPTVGEVSLPLANKGGGDFRFIADPGELLMVTFGFSSCPDICPTTLSDTRIALNQLGELADRVDFAFVSIDPERDSAEIVTDYVEAFVRNGHALRTDDQEALLIATDAFDVTYIIQENEEGDTEVAHTPHVFLVDDTGSLILTWPFGTTSADVASDLTIMLERQQA